MEDYSHKASVSIFRKTAQNDSKSSTPLVPNEIFEATNRVIESKGCELVKTRDCMYVVQYSQYGPHSVQLGDEWLPVYIAKILQWTSGGIKQQQMDEYLSDRDDDHVFE